MPLPANAVSTNKIGCRYTLDIYEEDRNLIDNRTELTGTEKHVDPKPHHARAIAEDPLAHHFVSQGKRHDDNAKEKVGNSKRGQEPVLDLRCVHACLYVFVFVCV